jgi:cobalt-zinc-cadmium efflux system protein
VGGVLTGSLAIISDAIHDLGDSISLGLSWYFQRLSRRGSSPTFTYGYRRFSLVGAIINGLILLVGSTLVISRAIPRLFHPATPNTAGMIILAVIGVVVNGIAVIRLRKGTTINERVVSLHLLEDVLGWIAVLFGSLVMHFIDFPIIDPLLSLAIALFVIIRVIRNLKESLTILLQGRPPEVDIEEIKKALSTLSPVRGIHDAHVWTLDGDYHVMSLHILLEGKKSLMNGIRPGKTKYQEDPFGIWSRSCHN